MLYILILRIDANPLFSHIPDLASSPTSPLTLPDPHDGFYMQDFCVVLHDGEYAVLASSTRAEHGEGHSYEIYMLWVRNNLDIMAVRIVVVQLSLFPHFQPLSNIVGLDDGLTSQALLSSLSNIVGLDNRLTSQAQCSTLG
jgi:hypothetical protein